MKAFPHAFVCIVLAVCITGCSPKVSPGGSENDNNIGDLKSEIESLRNSNTNSDKLAQQLAEQVKQDKVRLEGLQAEINKLRDQIDAIQSRNEISQLASLTTKIHDLETKMEDRHAKQVNLDTWITNKLFELDSFDSAFLDLTTKGFQRVDTSTGYFLISVSDAQPYLDGYKIRLNVGNPSFATYHGAKFNITWGKKWDPKSKSDYDTWSTGLKSKEIAIVEDLAPGSWNPVEIILSPAKNDELGYINLKVKVDKLSLRQVSRSSQ